jgi:hypothetical protein
MAIRVLQFALADGVLGGSVVGNDFHVLTGPG